MRGAYADDGQQDARVPWRADNAKALEKKEDEEKKANEEVKATAKVCRITALCFRCGANAQLYACEDDRSDVSVHAYGSHSRSLSLCKSKCELPWQTAPFDNCGALCCRTGCSASMTTARSASHRPRRTMRRKRRTPPRVPPATPTGPRCVSEVLCQARMRMAELFASGSHSKVVLF